MTGRRGLDGDELDKAVHVPAKLTGKRLRYRDSGFTHANRALRAELLKVFENKEGNA